MSSGRIGMILTYTRNKNNQNSAAPTPTPAAPVARQTYARLNRFPKVSMSNIIHKPAIGCSSCGN